MFITLHIQLFDAVGTKEGQNLFWGSAVIEGHLVKKVLLLSEPKIGDAIPGNPALAFSVPPTLRLVIEKN